MKHNFTLFALIVFTLSNVWALAQEPHWNQFRGPQSINHSFSTGIANSWGEDGPKLLWKIDTLGGGFSSVSCYGDMLFTMGDVGDSCFVFALDRKSGKEIWKTAIGRSGDGGGGHTGPLSVPACDGESVFVMNQFGILAALDMKDGKIRWQKNTPQEFGARRMAGWGFSMSPIIDGDKIVVPLGGDGGTLAAFSKAGQLLWRSTQITDPAAYTSAVAVEIEGVRQYLLLTGSNLVGISAADGKILWGATFPGATAVCSDPVLCGDVVIASCHYNVGAYFYRISKEGDTYKAVDFHGADRNLISHHGGIVAVGDHYYFLTNNAMVCVNASTAELVWSDRSVGKGSVVFVDGKIIARSERGDGTVAMVEATPEGYKELGRFDQPDRSEKNSWAYPVVVDGKLYLRDQGVLLCYDLK